MRVKKTTKRKQTRVKQTTKGQQTSLKKQNHKNLEDRTA